MSVFGAEGGARVLISILILLQELRKLLIVPQFKLLHRHDLVYVLLEVFEMVHQLLLLLDKLVNFALVFLKHSFISRIILHDVGPIVYKNLICVAFGDLLHSVLYSWHLWPEEDLELRATREVRHTRQLEEEHV